MTDTEVLAERVAVLENLVARLLVEADLPAARRLLTLYNAIPSGSREEAQTRAMRNLLSALIEHGAMSVPLGSAPSGERN